MDGIDIESIVDLLRRSNYKHVVLQFSSSLLSSSVCLCRLISSQLPVSMKFYVVANSSMDNAIDDVAAMHVSADVIVYFGTLLQVSSPFPVIMAIPSQPIADLPDCVNKLTVAWQGHKQVKRVLLWADLEFYWAAVRLSYMLPFPVILGHLPPPANLVNWKGNCDENDKRERVGGLYLPELTSESIHDNKGEDSHEGKDVGENRGNIDTAILFLGDPQSKALQSLSLRFPELISIIYSPADKRVEHGGGRGVHT
ncbi:hypothetical protein EON65_44710, partial [archaeon]